MPGKPRNHLSPFHAFSLSPFIFIDFILDIPYIAY
jgi:hypothetical protein